MIQIFNKQLLSYCICWQNLKFSQTLTLWSCLGWPKFWSMLHAAGHTSFGISEDYFCGVTLCWKNLKWIVVPKKAQIWPCFGFPTPISTPESNSPRKNTSIKGLGTVFFGFLHKKCLAGRIFSGVIIFFMIDPMMGKSQVKSGPQKSPNLTVCRVSHPNFDTGIQFSTQIDIYRGSRKGFFRLPS